MLKLRIILSSVSHIFFSKHLNQAYIYSLGKFKGSLEAAPKTKTKYQIKLMSITWQHIYHNNLAARCSKPKLNINFSHSYKRKYRFTNSELCQKQATFTWR